MTYYTRTRWSFVNTTQPCVTGIGWASRRVVSYAGSRKDAAHKNVRESVRFFDWQHSSVSREDGHGRYAVQIWGLYPHDGWVFGCRKYIDFAVKQGGTHKSSLFLWLLHSNTAMQQRRRAIYPANSFCMGIYDPR